MDQDRGERGLEERPTPPGPPTATIEVPTGDRYRSGERITVRVRIARPGQALYWTLERPPEREPEK